MKFHQRNRICRVFAIRPLAFPRQRIARRGWIRRVRPPLRPAPSILLGVSRPSPSAAAASPPRPDRYFQRNDPWYSVSITDRFYLAAFRDGTDTAFPDCTPPWQKSCTIWAGSVRTAVPSAPCSAISSPPRCSWARNSEWPCPARYPALAAPSSTLDSRRFAAPPRRSPCSPPRPKFCLAPGRAVRIANRICTPDRRFWSERTCGRSPPF
mmetsp:Transcript_23528/g.40138  ORF Transcript_23528/g.40138 Transcript_23528/m.40138 type:complete len:210 (+) Transcript_23528:567-1196(+)